MLIHYTIVSLEVRIIVCAYQPQLGIELQLNDSVSQTS